MAGQASVLASWAVQKIYLQQGTLCALDNASTQVEGFSMSQVAIKAGLTTADGREELLTEYLFDYPGCPDIANPGARMRGGTPPCR
jgi:hypothetical protein